MSDPILSRHDFLAWFRRGGAADLTGADPLTGGLPARGKLTVNVTVRATGGADSTTVLSPAQARLYGPGDVTGIDPRHVILTEPRNGTPAYEPNYLAGIEFDHPDFPWLFTPAAASGDRLRPWLCLLALAADEYEAEHVPGQRNPVIWVTKGEALPNLDESWAWAHAQVSGGVNGADLAKLAVNEPGRMLSRLVSPRRLRPRTRYAAVLVPAFDLGVKAALGDDVPDDPATQALPAWAAGAGGVRLPVLYRFDFTTSNEGDFESLVRKLTPRRLPPEVGMRPMDVSTPGWGLPSAGPPLTLSGALRSVSAVDTTWQATDREPFVVELAELVNRAAAPLDDPAQDPVVVPPLYGRWHAARTTTDPTQAGWFDMLATDPRHRTQAGFGSRVVIDQRVPLMASAWQQVEGVERANQLLRQAQLARAASMRLHAKDLSKARASTVLQWTVPLHAKLMASPRTVAATLADTVLPTQALSPAFRRVTRGRGPVRRRQRVRDRRDRTVDRLASGELTAAPPLGVPEGIRPLERMPVGAASQPEGNVTRWLGCVVWVPLAVLLLVLARLLRRLAVALPGPTKAAALAAAAALLELAWRLRRQGTAADEPGGGTFEETTSEAVGGSPTRPQWEPVQPGQPVPAGNVVVGAAGSTDSPAARDFRDAAPGILDALNERDEPSPRRPPADLGVLSGGIVGKLRPERTVPAWVTPLIELDAGWATILFEPETLDEIMVAPEFPQPMYEPLRDLSQDYLLPNLDLVQPDTLALLLENRPFLESYMVGLNHEMARLLLWNGYPTDQRGSPFRQFWDVRGYVPQPGEPTEPDALRAFLKDIKPVHAWPKSRALGNNRNRPATPGEKLILLVRGELLRRYPNAMVYATEAVWDPVDERLELGTREKSPQYRGTLDPDLTFFGFDITPDEARGNRDDRTKPQGWFFVFQQQPTEPRFGLDSEVYPRPTAKAWTQLSWAHVATDEAALTALQHLPVTGALHAVSVVEGPDNNGDTANKWGQDAAQLAYILTRRPIRVAVHARTMLPKATVG